MAEIVNMQLIPIEKPQAVVLAGPNGSGKSTCAELLLPEDMTFINADMIAQELSGERSTAADLAAGRVLIERMNSLNSNRKDFAIETTLATKTLLRKIESLHAEGYESHLFFMFLPNADLAVQRVAARVRAGGHDVPEETIRRRYISGLKMFFNHYMHEVDTWRLYDNSRIADPKIIAWGKRGGWIEVAQPELFDRLLARWMEVDFENSEAVDLKVKEAVRQAIAKNKKIGNSLPEWDGEQVRVISAEDLPNDES